MPDEAAQASCPCPPFPRRVSGTDPAAEPELSIGPAAGGQARGSWALGVGWKWAPVTATAFAEGETGTFHPSGQARKQEGGNRERGYGPPRAALGLWRGVQPARAPLQPGQVRLEGLLSISDQLLGLPEAWAGCGRGTGTGAGWLPSWMASDEWWPGTGTMVGKGCGPHTAGEAGFPGKSEVRGRAESAPADGAERWPERGRRVPLRSLELLRAPQPMRLPKGSAIQGQGAVAPPASPSALSLLGPTGSLDSSQTHQNVLPLIFCPNHLTFPGLLSHL